MNLHVIPSRADGEEPPSLWKDLVALAIIFLLALPAVAQQQTGDYVIGPKDLLEVRVLEIPDLNVDRRVSDNGTIDLPLLGQITVSGETAVQVQNQLAELLRSKYVNRANVSVIVKEFGSKPISIVGAVVHPGSLNVSGNWYLLQALSVAGGLDQTAGKKIYVIRRADNGLSDVLEIQQDDLLQSPSAMWNIPIYPGDVVNIPAKSVVKVFCLGEVRQPGALEFDSDDRITLLSVLAKAGGLTDRAAKTIRVKRRGPEGKDVETQYNYNEILSGKIPDPPLQADDVVIVPQSFF